MQQLIKLSMFILMFNPSYGQEIITQSFNPSFSSSQEGIFTIYHSIGELKTERDDGINEGLLHNTKLHVGVLDHSLKSSFEIYPNPIINDFVIKQDGEIVRAKLFDIQGRSTQIDKNISHDEERISVVSLPQGSYYLKLFGIDGNYTIEKIIKIN